MKYWRVDFTFSAILKTEQFRPDLASLEKHANELTHVENVLEISTSVKELVGHDSEGWKKT